MCATRFVLIPMGCCKWHLVLSVNFALRAKPTKLWRHNDLIYVRHVTIKLVSTTSHCFKRVITRQPGTQVHQSQQQQRAIRFWVFYRHSVLDMAIFHWKGIRVPIHDALRKWRLENMIRAILKQGEFIYQRLWLRWKPVPNILVDSACGAVLTQGVVTLDSLMLLTQFAKFLFEYIVELSQVLLLQFRQW